MAALESRPRAAYKFTIASMLPPVAYMTLIDKYVVSCSFVLILCAIQVRLRAATSGSVSVLLPYMCIRPAYTLHMPCISTPAR